MFISEDTTTTVKYQKYFRDACQPSSFSYNMIQLNVNITGSYTLSGSVHYFAQEYLYEKYFHPFNKKLNLKDKGGTYCKREQYKMYTYLKANVNYILVVSDMTHSRENNHVVTGHGPSIVVFNEISIPTLDKFYDLFSSILSQLFLLVLIESTYISTLTKDSPTYSRICRQGS